MEKIDSEIAKFVKKIELIVRYLMQTQLISKYRSIFRGKGLEFEEYRTYTSNDDAHFIDWKASLRSNQMLMKEFREERELNVFFLFDVSSSMIFGSVDKLKNIYATELIGSLSYFILYSRDKVGMLMFNDNIVKIISPSSGQNQLYVILKSLLDSKLYGGGYNLTKSIKFLMDVIRERGLVFIVSDFIGLEKDWERSLKTLASQSDVVGLMVRDPRDEKMPDIGQVLIGDPYSNKNVVIDTSLIKEKYENHVRNRDRKIKETFLRCNADLLHLSTAESFVKPIVEFLKRRERLLSK